MCVYYGMVVVTESVVHVFKCVTVKCLFLNIIFENLLKKEQKV